MKETSTDSKAANQPVVPVPPQDRHVTTQHSISIKGKKLDYSVTCGTTVLREESDKDGNAQGARPRAQLFSIAYAKRGVKDLSKRPITFVFNGGPGSSSVWLHIGLVGPKIVRMDAHGNTPPPPYALDDNALTLLSDSDLVFIDPIGTGFSRMLEGDKTTEFHDYQRDLDSVGEFIRSYLSIHHRWASPKYLAGESYGTTRAAALARHLQEKHSLWLNGLILISCALDFSTLRFDGGNDLPFILFLPTYAASAWYHKKLSPALQKKSLEALMAEVESFAQGEYAAALFSGTSIDAKTQSAVLDKLTAYTGLKRSYLEQTALRIQIHRFCKELLRDEGRTIGRFDSRFTGRDKDSAGEMPEVDPASTNIEGAFGSLINDYLRRELKFDMDLPYKLLARLYLSWSWNSFNGRYPSVVDPLRSAMHANPHMRVYIASGRLDLATPHFATDYTLNHLQLSHEAQKQVSKRYFTAGHMMYLYRPDLEVLAADLRDFVRA